MIAQGLAISRTLTTVDAFAQSIIVANAQASVVVANTQLSVIVGISAN